MYHLLNQTYVDTEARIDRTANTITISPQVGFEYIAQPNEKVGKHLGYGTNLDAFTSEQFLDLMIAARDLEEKVVIYTDGKTYARMYAMLIKAVFPSIDFENFRWFMLCKKATFNSIIVAMGEPRVDVLSRVVINTALCQELFDKEEPLQEIFNELVAEDADALSLEWHIARLRTEGIAGKIPKATKTILRRIALSNAHDAMDVWARHLTRPEFWDMAGADMETLLNAPSVFEGCLGLPHLASQQLLRPGLYDFRPNDTWIKGMLREAVDLMHRLEDDSSAERAAEILRLIEDDRNMVEAANCLDRVNRMFNGEMRIALAMRDTGKYDENLIRHILNMELSVLTAALEGAAW